MSPRKSSSPPESRHVEERASGFRRFLPEGWKDILDIGTTSVRWFLEETAPGIPPGSLVLDAGAGECQYRSLFEGRRYVAVDFAKGDADWNYSRLSAVAELTRLPFPDESFDAAVCTQVLEHSPEPKLVLKEICRALKPGGILLFTAPGAGEEHQQPYDFYRYTSFGLSYLFEEAGFEIEEMRRLGGMFWLLAILAPRINNFLFAGRKKIYLFPLYLLSKLTLGVIAPLLFFRWEKLDERKDLVLNYGIRAKKAIRHRS